MERRVLWVLFALVVAFAAVAYAQTTERLIVNMPYTFTVSGKQLPPGPYTIEPTGITRNILIIRSEDGKNAVQAEVLTRIVGGEAKPPVEPKVVLDRYEGDRYSLSEVFFAGEDGFLLAGAKNTPHKHETIKAKAKKS